MFVVATCLACLCARVVPSSWTTVYTVHRQVAAYLGTGCLRQRCVSSTLLPAREILDPAISPQRLLRTIMVKLPCCYTSSEPSLWLCPLWLGAHMSRQRQRRPTGRTCNLCDCLCAPSHFENIFSFSHPGVGDWGNFLARHRANSLTDEVGWCQWQDPLLWIDIHRRLRVYPRARCFLRQSTQDCHQQPNGPSVAAHGWAMTQAC